MKKNAILDTLQSAVKQVRQGLTALSDERRVLQSKRDDIFERLHQCGTRPLSKVAMIELCSRVVDFQAAHFKKKFREELSLEIAKVEPSDGSVKRAICFADAQIIMMYADSSEWFGGVYVPPCQVGLQALAIWVPVYNYATCYFFGDAIKSKLPELWEDVNLPYPDDGKTWSEREDEVKKIRAELAEVDGRLSALTAELAELKAVSE